MNRPNTPDDFGIPMPEDYWLSTSPAELAKEKAGGGQMPPPRRRAQSQALTSEAHVWLARLPPHYQPLTTARRHPHIVNELTHRWGRPNELLPFFRDLLLSDRTGREGFSFEVISEITDLQSMVEAMQSGEKF